jgi:hypothetical protein
LNFPNSSGQRLGYCFKLGYDISFHILCNSFLTIIIQFHIVWVEFLTSLNALDIKKADCTYSS